MSPLESTERVLKEAGIAYTVEDGKRHHQVRFTVRGVRCLVTVSRSASDHRAALNARATVRREILRAMAAENS